MDVQVVEKKQIVLVTDRKRYLRFQISDISEMKKTSVGVRSMKLDEDEKIALAFQMDPKEERTVKIQNKKYNFTNTRLKRRDAKPELL